MTVPEVTDIDVAEFVVLLTVVVVSDVVMVVHVSVCVLDAVVV